MVWCCVFDEVVLVICPFEGGGRDSESDSAEKKMASESQISTPSRKVGKQSLKKLSILATEHNMSDFEVRFLDQDMCLRFLALESPPVSWLKLSIT